MVSRSFLEIPPVIPGWYRPTVPRACRADDSVREIGWLVGSFCEEGTHIHKMMPVWQICPASGTAQVRRASEKALHDSGRPGFRGYRERKHFIGWVRAVILQRRAENFY